jgi:hypothetical protein
MAVPQNKAGNIACACLKSGDRFQFDGLGATFQSTCDVGSNAVAVFVEGNSNKKTKDRFDFQNGNEVAIADMPLGAKFRPLELVGIEKPVTEVEAAQVPDVSEMKTEEEVLVYAGAGSRTVAVPPTANTRRFPLAGLITRRASRNNVPAAR